MTQLMLPATQPVSDSLEDNSQPVEYENPWGKFYPMRINVGHSINLTQDSFTVGRYVGCDYTLTKDEVGEKLYDCISNYQFKVERKEEEPGFFVVLITDLSSNGTFLNGNLIGKCQASILSHNDNIAIAKCTNNVFTFFDLSAQASPYPDEINKTYAIYNLLGKGGYGEVRLVLKKQTTEKFAMKSIHLTPIEEKKVIDVFAEVKVLRQLNHDNIVKLQNQFLEEETMYIFLEYMKGGDLATFIKERRLLSENMTKFIYYQILLGVEYLHTNKIIHRDLKPANILLSAKTDYPKIKITDFGLSKILTNGTQTQVHTRCGTLSFAPPELQFSNVSRTCDFRVDVWSLGVILYLCLSGVLPFRRDRKDMPMETQINTASYSMNLDIFKKVSNPPKFIIKRCLNRLPRSRCMVDEIIEDDWFRKDESLQRKLSEQSQDINFTDKENANEPPLKKRRV